MARLPRLAVPGHLHHLLQRGHQHHAVFADAEDYRLMLTLLAELAPRHQVALHAYALLPDHFHLLVTPQTDRGLPQLMQALGRRYVQAYNRRHARRGGLWDGRYRGTVMQAEHWLLPCMAYLDLHPVRAGLAARAADYPWSSYGHYAGLRADKLLRPHPLYWSLGNTPFAREARYAELVSQGLLPAQQRALGEAVLKGWALGDAAFTAALQAQTPRRLLRARAGRPPRAPADPSPR